MTEPEESGPGSRGWIEYERRYLVLDKSAIRGHEFTVINQAYLHAKSGWTVRVRRFFGLNENNLIEERGTKFGFKGPQVDRSRPEHEWDIRPDWAAQLFKTAEYKIYKKRYHLVTDAGPCDVDEFWFDNDGLLIAEFEADGPQLHLHPPDWCGREITDDRRYDNENLAIRPWSTWPKNERY